MEMITTGELTLKIMKEAGWYNDKIFSIIESHIKGEILEIGAGIGNFTDLLKEKGNVTAIDIEPKYVRLIKDKNKTIGISSGFGDIEKNKYYFKNRKFDTIVCLNVLEHIQDDQKALRNMFSLLNKSGELILLVPAHMELFSRFDRNLGHFRRYNVSQISEKLIIAGFEKVNLRYINWLAAIGWFFFLKLSKNNQLPDREVKIFNYFGKFLLWPERYVKLPFGLSVLAIAEK